MFDRDELGDDPEEDTGEESELCPRCLEPWEDCECEEDDE
jgi:hypothetical protein